MRLLKLLLGIRSFFKGTLTELISSINQRFNGLPAKRRKIFLVVCGLAIALICAQIIINALVVSSSQMEMPEPIITPPTSMTAAIKGSTKEPIVLVGQMKSLQSQLTDYHLVAMRSNGDLLISQKILSEAKTEIAWRPTTTDELRGIEEHYRFIQTAPDTIINE